jgi:hypothetical protein
MISHACRNLTGKANLYRMHVAVFAVAWFSLLGIATSPLPSPSPFPAPAGLATPLSSTGPSASPSPTPVATPTILMLPPDAAPQILYVHLSSDSPRAGDTLSMVVLTSSNVASVEIRIAGFGSGLPKTGVGHFEGSNPVPHIPFFMSHNFTLDVVARNTAGAEVKQSLPFHIR